MLTNFSPRLSMLSPRRRRRIKRYPTPKLDSTTVESGSKPEVEISRIWTHRRQALRPPAHQLRRPLAPQLTGDYAGNPDLLKQRRQDLLIADLN
jgi:hypothetical protein